MTSPQDDQQDDDTIVWQRLARGIKAYAPEARPARQPKSPRARPKQPRAVKAMPISPPPSRRPAPDPIDLRKGEHAGIDGATRRRLAQGQVTIESRLDLHGLTAAQAERRLARFIDGAAPAAHRGDRCGPRPALHILGHRDRRSADGGGGALYVMLRRKRDST